MRKIYKRLGAVLCALGMVLMLAAGLTINVSAADNSGNLTLYCKEGDVTLSGMQWSIYKVGKRSGNKYNLGGNFAKYPVTFGDLTVEDLTEAASTLENFVALDFLFPERMGVTNSNGAVRFENLEAGIYLACGRRMKKDDYTYIPVPIIFEIDGKDKEINGYPKFLTKRTLPGDTDRYAVRKIWANADGVTDKPTEITVDIYKDGVVNNTIKLSQENNWTYSWDGDATSDWRVKEVTVPPGCFVMYRNNTTQYIIMNNYDNELLRQTTTTTTVTTTATSTTQAPDTTTRSGPIDIYSTSATTETTVTTRSGPIDIYSTSATTETTVTTRSGPIDIYSTSATTTTTVTTTRTNPINSGEDTRTTNTSSKDVKPDSSTTIVSGDLTTSSTDSGTSTSSTSDVTTSTDTDTNTTTKKSTTPSGGGNGGGGGGGNSVRTSKSTAKTTTTTIEKLPQTGQLWWPVPVMLFSGIIFVAIGLRLLLNGRRED